MNNIFTNKIKTQRLILRCFCLEDVPAVYKNWASSAEVQSMYAEPVYDTQEKAEKLVKDYIENYENPGYYRWAITLKETGECIGQIAYFFVDSKNFCGEIEYCIGIDFQNKGFATEASKAIIEHGFENIGFHKIQISHISNNLKSQKVIQKCGFTYEGKLRDALCINGKFFDRFYYSILEDEYRRRL